MPSINLVRLKSHLCLLGCLLFLFHVLCAAAIAQNGPGPALSKDSQVSLEDLERKIKDVYQSVSPAVVRVEATKEKARSGCSAVIVTAEGHVLMPAFSSDFKLTFHLPDGRSAAGTLLGRSHEWNVALAKLDGDGPWPHIEPLQPAPVHAGQAIVTLAYSLPESKIALQPLLDVAYVNRCVPGQWFMTPDGSQLHWKQGNIAFDLDGRLLGIETRGYPDEGPAYTHIGLAQSFWNYLIGGKNVDQIRLSGRENNSPPPTTDKKPTISSEAQEKAIAATVQIRRQPGEKGLSGVIIAPDGMVATCAHHFIMPGTQVIVSLPDGRDLAGEIIGISFPSDIGLVRITEPGAIPFVERGDSTRMTPGDSCIAIGYGPLDAKARKPLVRKLSIDQWPDGRWSHELPAETPRSAGGDCGGGVFDANGRLVAIFLPGSSKPDGHKRIELFRAQWEDLHAAFEQATASELKAAEEKLQDATIPVRSCTAEVLDDDQLVALATIVAANGTLITKASILPPHPRCRLADGRVLPAAVLKTIREHDVAILKIDAENLPAVQWSSDNKLPAGTLVGLAAKTSSLGFIAHSPLTFPVERGWLGGRLRDGEQGTEVEELFDFPAGPQFAAFTPRPLRKGDIILSVNGRPTPNSKELFALLDTKQPNPLALAGDLVHLMVQRKGEQVEFDSVLGPPSWPRMAGQSARCSGFSGVYGVAATPNASLCGGPVHDRDGRALGIVIASRQTGWLLVLPAATVKAAAAD